jgi:hypothetical protein
MLINKDRVLAPAPIVGACRYNVTRDVKTSNAAMARLFAVDPALAAAGVSHVEFQRHARIHPDDMSRVVEALDASFQNKCDFLQTYRVRDAEGHEHVVFGQGATFQDEASGDRIFTGTLLAVASPRLHGFARGLDSLDDVATACVVAREEARSIGAKSLTYMLDMALLELGHRLAAVAKRKLPGWN